VSLTFEDIHWKALERLDCCQNNVASVGICQDMSVAGI
jgi:hypothetical protein